MKYLSLLLIGISLFFHVACGESPRLNSSPTPIIHSINVVDSPQLPKERIDYTTLNETWANISIIGENFYDEYDNISNVRVIKDNQDMGCRATIGVFPANEYRCTLDLWGYLFYGPGTYMVSVKTKFSAWSNALPIEIY